MRQKRIKTNLKKIIIIIMLKKKNKQNKTKKMIIINKDIRFIWLGIFLKLLARSFGRFEVPKNDWKISNVSLKRKCKNWMAINKQTKKKIKSKTKHYTKAERNYSMMSLRFKIALAPEPQFFQSKKPRIHSKSCLNLIISD